MKYEDYDFTESDLEDLVDRHVDDFLDDIKAHARWILSIRSRKDGEYNREDFINSVQGRIENWAESFVESLNERDEESA